MMRLQIWFSDLRIAWRSAIRRPGFTTLVVLTLALGLGVNSAVFALLDSVLWRPLPYRDPARLVFVWQTLPEHGVFELEATPFDYRAWHDLASFSGLAMVAADAFTLSGDTNPERLRGARVTASLLPLLGVATRFGRGFDAGEDGDGAEPVAILSDGLWRRRFGADRNVIGQRIPINGTPHTIVGVLPPFVALPGPLAGSSELLLPARMSAAERINEISHNYTVIARLAPGATLSSAAAELDAFARRLAVERPDSHRNIGARPVTLNEQTVHVIRPTLLLIAGGVGLLLLVACANTATLVLARAAGRQRERAVRAALGATSSQLLSHAMAESVVYVALGTTAALILGGWTLHAALPLLATGLPPERPIELTGRAVLLTALVAAVVALVLGALVTRQRPRALSQALKTSARTTIGGAPARTRNLLVLAQVSLAVVLLCAAGLLISSFVKLSHVTPGFDPRDVMTFRVSLSDVGYDSPGRRISFVKGLLERLAAAPGVSGAAVASMIPFGGGRGANGVEIEGRPRRPGEAIIIDQRYVTSTYFQTMRIPVVKGRSLRAGDDEQAERVVVINRTMAERYWPAQSPLNHRVRVTAGVNEAVWFRIVGVVDNVRHVGLGHEPVPEMYYPYPQAAVGTFTVVIRTDADATSIVPAARQIIGGLDPRLPLYDLRTLEQRIAASFAQTRGTMVLLLVSAVLAASLAAVAIYGSIWFSVSERIPEIGIRLALGAARTSVCTSVIARALLLSTAGAAAGTAGALAMRPFIAGMLFQTSATDVRTYLAVLLLLLGLTVVAAIVPAIRAMRVDPIAALRDE